MNLHPLFIEGFNAGRNWRSNPADRDYSKLPYYRQTTEQAQTFNRAFACALQADPSTDADAAFTGLIQQRPDLADLYGRVAH